MGAMADSGCWRGEETLCRADRGSAAPHGEEEHCDTYCSCWKGSVEMPTDQPSPAQAAHLNSEVLVTLAQHSIYVLQDQIRSLLQQVVVEVEAQQLSSIHFLQAKRAGVSPAALGRATPGPRNLIQASGVGTKHEACS